ncbi:MAG: hypothetical protein M1827_004925 [Pycnora praestabilis]|nr:MAG: hypothetical protein M1827_004925 [Pycnora praestabilis]
MATLDTTSGFGDAHASTNGGATNGSTPARDVSKASSMAEIQAILAQLNDREASVAARLDSLIASQNDLSRELGRLDLMRAHLGSQAITTRSIGNGMLSNAASTANRISSAVKRLDLEQSRVKATLDVVEQVVELKACVLGVTGSMGAPQDWETAAGYLSRASKIPKEIVNGQFAEEIVPTAEVPDPPNVTLESAAESLCGLFLREFEKAVKDGDGMRVTRFFKLFPLIERSDVGLDVYGRYVCQGVASRARSNLNAGTGGSERKEGFFYANALTKLFEHIAQIVDGHGGLVERHYGTGRMVKIIERLQLEADVQGGIVLETWGEERNIDRRLTDIKSYAFSFLVQSFLPVQRGHSATSRANSPANREATSAGRNSEDEGVDMKEVDGLLSEIAVMLGRWSLYSRFLANKCRDPEIDGTIIDEPPPLHLPPLLLNSNLSKKLSERLIDPFNVMTTFFFRRSVEKSFQLDEAPPDLSLNLNKPTQSNPPHITSAVDDVMYIVNKVLQKSLATSQRTVISGVVPTIGRVLGSDFIGMIQRKLRDESYPKGAVQGALPPEDKIVTFLILLNNLDVATDYIKRIVSSHIDTTSTTSAPLSMMNEESNSPSTPLISLFPFDHDSVFVSTTLKALQTSFETKTTELISDGLHVTFNNVIKPRLRPILADAFRDVDYLLTEGDLADLAREADGDDIDDGAEGGAAEKVGLVKQHFAHSWHLLIIPITRLLTPPNFSKLLTLTLNYLSKLLEKRIWSFYGRINELGAVRLERDIAGVVSTAVKDGRYGLRDAFLRCTQICLILNMDEDEWEELSGAVGNGEEVGIEWRLDADERMRAKAMMREGK